jgi:hypothetical protein
MHCAPAAFKDRNFFTKGNRMKKCMPHRLMGFCFAAVYIIFTLTIVVQAQASQAGLQSQLHENGIAMKLVRLDRTDGFVFGLSITDPQGQSVVLAPDFGKMLLVESSGSEMTLQSDTAGGLQIIQADDQITYLVCLVQAFLKLLASWSACVEGDLLCQMGLIVSLIGDINSCPLPDNSTLTTTSVQTTTTTSQATTTTQPTTTVTSVSTTVTSTSTSSSVSTTTTTVL